MVSGAETDCDVAVLGGGIAGLWILDRLRARRFRAVLLERSALGDGQTIAAQGIVHSGLKYHVSRDLTLDVLAAMPARWQAALAGRDGPDLRAARVLSSKFHFWVPPRFGAELVARAAREVARSDTGVVPRSDWPAPFCGPQTGGALSIVSESVLDVASVLGALAERHRDVVRLLPAAPLTMQDNRLACGPLSLRPRCIVMTAGAGNEQLPAALGVPAVPCQRRPLQQVVVSGMREPVYAHCLGVSVKPLATVTSHPDGAGGWFWYVGGGLAETGAGMAPERLLRTAREDLPAWFPGADFSQAGWASFPVDRAEFGGDPGTRPGDVQVEQRENVLVAWPTKLALAPRLADVVIERVAGIVGAVAGRPAALPDAFAALAEPEIALPPWRRIAAWS